MSSKNLFVEDPDRNLREYKLQFENSNELFFSLDFRTKLITKISPACEKIYGFCVDDFLTNDNLWYNLIHPDDKSIIKKQIIELKEGRIVTYEYRIISKEQKVKWLQNKIIPTLDHSGNLIQLDGISCDITEQILTNKCLKENKERYDLLCKATNDIIWDWDLETSQLYWNESYKKILGYGDSNLEQNVNIWNERIIENDRNRIIKGIHKVLEESKNDFWEGEYGYYKADGTILYFYDRAYIVYNEAGRAVRMVGAMQDITFRKKAEERLQRTKNNLRTILENTDTGYILLNKKGEITSFNNVAKTMLEEEIEAKISIGIHFAEALPEKRQEKVKNTIKNVLENGRKIAYEVRYKYPHKIIWLNVNMLPVFDLEKNVIGVNVAATNISEKKNADEHLLKSEANLQTIFKNTETAYVLLDKKFNVISFNNTAVKGYRKQLGFTLEEGKNLFESQPCNRRSIAKKRHEKVLKGETVSYDISFGVLNDLYWYHVKMLPVFDKMENVIGLIIASEDITQRKRTETEKEKITTDLMQRNKDLEQFAYIISHNLRAPVANIIGLGVLLQNRSVGNEKDLDRLIKGIGESTEKLDNVIADLNLILQTTQNIVEYKEIVKFDDLVYDIKTSISTLIQLENVTITTDFVQVEQIFTFKTYLHSIFYNLISNSIKYKREGQAAIVHIKTKRTENNLTIFIKDNGMGIDLENNATQIFGLYKRFHNHIDGKGMGLYMVKAQVEKLGGTIKVQSEVNVGTEFQIEFNI